MADRVPIELLDLVARNATDYTLFCLSTISHQAYHVSMPVLYASISEMSITRTVKCLRTLSAKPEVARLVRSFTLGRPPSHAFRAFDTLLAEALCNMTGLHVLRVDCGITRSSILSQMSCQLTTLGYTLPSPRERFPISQFLASQPNIEQLSICCIPADLDDLDPTALPALKNLTAPYWLLPKLLPPRHSRLSRISRLRIMGPLTDIDQFLRIADIFMNTESPRSLELMLGIDATRPLLPEVASIGLALFGLLCPSITSLWLLAFQEGIQSDKLQNMFAFALPWIPNLRRLIIVSAYKTTTAYVYTGDSSLVQASPAFMANLTALQALLETYAQTSVDTSVLFSGPEAQAHNQSSPSPNAMEISQSWFQSHAGLKFVAFDEHKFPREEVEQEE